MARTAKARREEIYHLALTRGLASVEELSDRFDVTPSTIRRDLALLDDEGKLARTYGGAVAISANPEASLRQRVGVNFEQKTAIARHAASLVCPGETILLDGGSTVGALAHLLHELSPLHIVTPAINILLEFTEGTKVEIDCLGGRLRPLSNSFVLGADAVTAKLGICEADHDQIRLKELISRRAKEVYVLADATKLGQMPFHSWGRLPLPWTLITDNGVSEKTREEFENEGIAVHVVDGSCLPNGAIGAAGHSERLE
jgi:DeoR/GlpR family transcriptional regulator of sugar metabolism